MSLTLMPWRFSSGEANGGRFKHRARLAVNVFSTMVAVGFGVGLWAEYNHAPHDTTAQTGGVHRIVFLPDDRGVVLLARGEQFALELGNDYSWTLAPVDSGLLRPIEGDSRTPTFVALREGETVLWAHGTQPCRTAAPPCSLPDREFTVTVRVSR